MRNSFIVAIALVMLAVTLSFVSCERSGRHGEGVTSWFGTGNSVVGVCGDTPETNVERTLSIEQAIAEAREYEPPASVTNSACFDPLVFEMLRKEFISQIESNGNRITSAAPLGDAGRVTDLTYDDTGRLNWTYVNTGDYDSSGEVGIPDITMIAQYYLANTSDGIGDDALETWIDGDKSGEVGISDITPIAQGYLNYVSEYRILTSSQPDSGFTAIGSPVPSGSTGVFPHTFSVLLPVGAQQYVAVAPVDDHGEQGEMSGIVVIQTTEWHFDSIQGSGYLSFNRSLCVDSNNNVHICFYNYPETSLEYGYFDQSIWTIETVDSIGDVGAFSSIAVDLLNRPHISYHDATQGHLKYAIKDNNNWSCLTIDQSANTGRFTSIDTDSKNYPYISYRDYPGNVLKIAYFDGLKWKVDTVDNIVNYGSSTSIAIDTSDNIHISYDDSDNNSIKYAFFNGSDWNIESIDSEFGGSSTSIAVDSNDLPHISYNTISTINNLNYAHFNGVEWIAETIDIYDVVGNASSIAIDMLDHPQISYCDSSNQSVKLACYNGSIWQCKTIDFGRPVGINTSIDLDTNDNTHIICQGILDNTLEYAWFR